jgi:hypothetical protein
VSLIGREDTAQVDRLDQLRARSRHEVEAHAGDLGDAETGRRLIDEATELLAALRLWAESQFRTDQAVRLLLAAGDARALNGVARELLELGTPEEQTAGRTIVEIATRSSGYLTAIAGYALRAL